MHGSRLIVLHGRAGGGKSCVLLQLVERFEEMGIPYLPLRFDRRPPRVSAERYGTEVCDLPDSPAVVLHSLYRGRRAVLVVDQLDAVRWTATHAIREAAVRFAAGPGFMRHPIWLVEALRRFPDSLLPLAPIFSTVCGRLATDMSRVAQDRANRNAFELDRFVPLLLRLYEQAEQVRDQNLRSMCLDWWDRLLEARIGGALELLSKLDQGTAPGI